VLQNTQKGKELLALVEKRLIIKKRDISEAVAGNETFQCATLMPDGYHKFWELCRKNGFIKTINTYSTPNYHKRIFNAKFQWNKYKLWKIVKINIPQKVLFLLKRLYSRR
jgi:hypothetical protein